MFMNVNVMKCVFFSRYPSNSMGYPSNHYIGHGQPYYPDMAPGGSVGSGAGAYRDRYPSSNNSGVEWNRDRDFVDYRREYDRRPPPSSGTS